MSKVTKIVLATAAATGLTFSPVFACTYMKSAEHKKPMVTTKLDVQMSTSDAITIKPETGAPTVTLEATETAPVLPKTETAE